MTANADWVLVRGVNFDPANMAPPPPAARVGAGNDPAVNANEMLTNLSVNCAKNPGPRTITEMIGLLPGDYYYQVNLSNLGQSAKIAEDPKKGNQYHCLLSDVTPKTFVSKATWKKK
jgi:hypothetical protein